MGIGRVAKVLTDLAHDEHETIPRDIVGWTGSELRRAYSAHFRDRAGSWRIAPAILRRREAAHKLRIFADFAPSVILTKE